MELMSCVIQRMNFGDIKLTVHFKNLILVVVVTVYGSVMLASNVKMSTKASRERV